MRGCRWLPVCLVLLILQAAAGQEPPSRLLTRAQMERDLDRYRAVAERAWAWEEDKRLHFGVDVAAQVEQARQRLPEQANRRRFLDLLRELVAKLQDGHARIRDPQSSKSPRHLLPFDLLPDHDGNLLLGPWQALPPNDRAPDWFVAGATVRSWQGRPVEQALADIMSRIPASTAQQRLHRAAQEMARCRPGGAVLLRVRTREGRSRSFTAKPHSRYWSPTPRFEAHPGDIGLLKIPTFSPYYGQQDSRELWLGELHEALEKLSKKPHRVLDLRGNSGGSDYFLAALLHHLMKPGFELYRSRRKGSPELRRLCLEKGWPLVPESGWEVDSLEPYRPSPPGCDCEPLTGRLYVLQDAGSFSATDCALAVLKDQRPETTLVGRASAGGWGAPVPLCRLPESGFELTLTTRYGTRIDGRPLEGRAVEPHIEVPITPEALAERKDGDLEAVREDICEGEGQQD